MKIFDLLRMSISNLWKRKLRTVLTVLGVVIGVTSIVVMIALGNGLKESMLDNYGNYSSMTQIRISSSGGFYFSSSGSSGQDEEKRLDDAFVEQLRGMEHVESVFPKLNLYVLAKAGKYAADLDIYGITQEEMASMNIPIAEGKLPDSTTELKFFYGNSILTQFYIEKTYVHPWWEKQEVPDVDVMKDPIFIIFDRNAYWNSQGGGNNSDGTPVKQPKKYIIEACGRMEGEIDDWNNDYCQSVICDIDALKAELKRIFKKNPIPGQPTRKNGKPYNELFYSQITVQVDDMENVTALTNMIKDMGYEAYSSVEWIQQQMDTMNTIQAVLGAIGAVAMLVAAISITNTMMMSIYERTKEIGVMKVLGCDIRNIQGLFLMEAGFIGFIGGVVGVGFSYVLGMAINGLAAGSDATANMGITGAICRIPLWLSPVAIVFAVVIGMVAGFIPSLRAMRLSPLAAIRNE
ncbi:MAG: ABC transporter permease [Lachnospiraceae bacterium]|nr:ABC transporter permease [Lachnospiraceae bacterium]